MARRPRIRDGEDPSESRLLWTFLTTLSAVGDELERARLTATGLPSVVPCALSGLGLSSESAEPPHLTLQEGGRELGAPVLDDVRDEVHRLAQEAYRHAGLLRVSAEDGDVALPSSFRKLGVRHLAVVPLTTLRHRIGFLLAGRTDNEPFSKTDEVVLLTLVEHLATGIENLRLYRQLKQHADTLEDRVATRTEDLRRAEQRRRMLLDVNNAIIANRDRASLFQAVTQAVQAVLPFDCGGLTLHDRGTDMLQVYALGGPTPPRNAVPVGESFPCEGSHVEEVLRQKKPVIRDLRRHRIGLEDELFREGVRCTLAVPLMSGEAPLGTLGIGSRTADRYSADDIDLMTEVAQQVAIAVENMLAHEEIAVLKAKLEQENRYLQEEIETHHNHGEILGESQAIRSVLKAIETVAPTDVNVVITGETGTGKELVARALHNLSARRRKTLIKVNCASIPKELFESEFFGHVKGAFTGALRDRVGRFELADGGTLFLDEVGEIPLDMQSKLLRVLQEGEFERVGQERTRSVDVRILAATNRDLKHEVEAGRFRQDLYYRLNVFPIEVPPLRQRDEDIPRLAAHYIRQAAGKLKRPPPALTQANVTALRSYGWPGNVRELQNVIDRAVIVSGSGPLQLDLPAAATSIPSATTPASSSQPEGALEVVREDQKRQRHRENILGALRKTHWKVAGKGGAAELLGISPSTLTSRIKKLGIARSD